MGSELPDRADTKQEGWVERTYAIHHDGTKQLLRKARAQRNARANKRKREARNRAIAAFALNAARNSDELADNPQRLSSYVLRHWKDEWGKRLAPSTVRRILAEQKVASRLR